MFDSNITEHAYFAGLARRTIDETLAQLPENNNKFRMALFTEVSRVLVLG